MLAQSNHHFRHIRAGIMNSDGLHQSLTKTHTATSKQMLLLTYRLI
jgi:hypothetical protein